MNKNRKLHFEMETKAGTFRQENGFGATEPIHLSSFLLKKNVVTLFKPLSPGLAGMAVKARGMCFMMINQEHTLGKQHFTIGHELYHLFIQENFTSQRCVTGLFEKQTDPEEKKADMFAACLLLPELGVQQMIPEKELDNNAISAETILKIQHYYQVSMQAVLYRLIDLGVADKSYYDSYQTGKTQLARTLGYETKLYKKANEDRLIGDYGVLANQLFKEQKISESHFFHLMGAINIDPLATPSLSDEE